MLFRSIILVINKIDLPSAMPEEIEDQIVELIGCPRDSILRASGKTGEGVYDILNAIVERVPAPSGDPETPLQCLILYPARHYGKNAPIPLATIVADVQLLRIGSKNGTNSSFASRGERAS